MITSALDIATTDGINEKGLVANVLWLVESQYPKFNPKGKSKGVTIAAWAQYVLDNFATVKEAVDELRKEKFVIVSDFIPGTQKFTTLHLSISDATGENSFNSNDRKNNDKHLVELGGKMAFEVLVAIHLQLEKRVVNIFTGTKYEGTLEGGAEVKANADFTGKTKFYSDDSGFYGVPSGKFEGLSFSGSIELKGEFGEQEKKPIFSDERKVEFTYEGIPASEEITLEKFYNMKNEK